MPLGYLLWGVVIEQPNHVWCADIIHILVRRGFLYLMKKEGIARSSAVGNRRIHNDEQVVHCAE